MKYKFSLEQKVASPAEVGKAPNSTISTDSSYLFYRLVGMGDWDPCDFIVTECLLSARHQHDIF